MVPLPGRNPQLSRRCQEPSPVYRFGTREWPFLRSIAKAPPNGIHPDVIGDRFPPLVRPEDMIIGLVLPEAFSRSLLEAKCGTLLESIDERQTIRRLPRATDQDV
jgi:hypothetical protein